MANDNNLEIPSYILNTTLFLKRIGIGNLTDVEVNAIISILYDEMSDRNLAESLSHATGDDYTVCLNRVYVVASKKEVDLKEISRMKTILKDNGYEEWLKDN